MCPKKVYECDISQFSTVGSEVGRIEVIGASNSSQLQYRLESSSSRNPNVKDGAHLFSIHNLTGVITISKQLDFKKVQLASALVTISSPTTAITAPVYFNILIPYAIRFSKSDLIFQIDENSAVGTFVGWANTGNMGTVHYTIVPYAAEDEPLPFDLDVQSGVLTVKGVLDHEGPFPFYTFQIEAKGSHEVSDIVDVMVVVNDQNDCPPVFENAAREEHNIYYFEASVNEDCLPGCDIFKLEVEDEDLVNKFYYSIDELSDPLGIFDINNDGLLTLTTEGGPTLNYIKQKQHLLKVQLDDDCAPNLYHTIYAYIMVHVVDTNNNAPSFHPTTTTQLLVSESASIGQSIGRVFATDLDGGRNGSVFYRILPASLPHTEFVVDALSGDILVNAALDRESNITHYQFSVEARDGGHPSLRSIQNIRVVVLDEDDHPPNFCNNQTTDAFTISEDALVGHFVGRICYRDSDKGSNQAAIFQIIDGNEDCFFHIDPISGSIFVARPLDFEQFSNHTLDISMTAFSGKYDPIFMKVVINIKNVIDEPPIFMDGRQLFLKVAENVPGLYPVEIRRIEARSQEQYDMSITYSLHQGDASLFHINSSTALLSLLKPLDRELSEEYELVVKARSFARSTSIRVHISVVNVVNNHAPIFTQPFHRLQLQENMTGTNTSILTLKAVDLDEGVNGLVRYFLFNEKDSGEYFWIDPFTGVLGLKHALDAEQYEEMVVQVQAMDSGQLIRQYSDVVEVIVEVLVLNDNAPAIRADLLDVFMPEDARKGDVVYAVDAFDADKTAVLNYFLAGEDKRYFSIDNRGVVTVADVGLPSVLLSGDSFDAVSRPYSLLVTVSDEDGQNATVALKFYTAANELFPVFKKLKSSRVFVLENSTNQLLAHFHSVSSHRHDPIIRYSIAAGDPHSCFHLDSFAGQLFGLTFDREHLGVHHLQIAATILSSPSYTSYMSFTVVVEDVNDNAPRFLQGLTSVEIIENGPPQPNLTTVKANDTDSGVNAKISYSIIAGNTNQVFSIDPVTGAVASLASLDREEVSTYRLVVQAADHGFPSLKSECIVKVEVIDENDNAPKFTRLFHASIREDANLLDFVLQVMSFDPDSPEFSRNSYALLESDGSEDFNIDSLSGKIVVANLLDREKRQQYRLRVRAFDELWSVATSVTIFIEDVNDHAPVFEKQLYEFTLPLSANATDTTLTIGQVVALDADKDKNAQLIYFFSTNQFWHSYFYIHPLDGTISVDGKDLKKIEHILTSTRRSMVRLEVIARDSGIPSKHASNFTVVLIRWSEFSNHELPVATDVQSFEIRDCDFGERYVTIWMDEDIKAGTTIYKLDNTNTTSTYHLEHINFNHPVFSVDKDGQVSTLLDSPLRSQSCVSPKMYIVQISSGPSSSATVLRVKKRSKSVAALPIMFLPPRLNYTISAQSTNGTIVGVLRTEEEMPLHQSTMFLMQQKKNAEHLLEIDRKTGEIRLPKNANTTLKASSSGWVIAKNSAYESSFSRSFVNVEFSLDLPAIPTFSQPFYNIFIQESIEHTPVRLVDFQFPLAHTSAKMEITNTAGNEIFCIDTARSTTTLNLCSKPIGLNDIYIVKLAIVEQLNYPVVRSRTTLHVHLNGTLDERKVMESEVCYVMENTPPGQRIFQVPGDGPNSTFRIMDDSLANAFEVDESTGTLLTKKIFDREARELYSLPISVTSSRSTASDRKVVDMRVLIQDADDNPFRPNQPLTLLIYSIEGVFNGMVEQCHAYDSDSVYSSCKEFPLVGGLHGTQSQLTSNCNLLLRNTSMGSHRLIGGSPTTPLTINLHMVQLDQNLLNNSISLQAQFATKRAMADLLHKLQDTIPDMQLHLVGVLQTGEYQHHLLVSMLDSLHNLLPPAETLLILNNYIQKHTLVNIVGLKASVMKQNICDDTPHQCVEKLSACGSLTKRVTYRSTSFVWNTLVLMDHFTSCSPINKNTDNNCSIERPDESTSYYSFDHDSYMQLSNLGQEQLQTISLQFITQQSTGVLLYSSLPNHGFFAVDIINGQLRLAVSNLNSEIQEVLLNMSLNRSAKWHQLSLTVHHSPQQPAYIMAVLDVCNAQDDCEHCSTNDCKAILSPISWLPLFWDTLLVGGLDEQAFNQPNQVSDYGFVGCVRQVLFNNNHLLAAFHHHFDHVQQVDPSRVIGICALLENIGEACTTTDQPACSGHCIKESNKFNRCICVQDGAYEAANCSSDFDTISLDKSSLRYRLSNHYRRQLLFVPRAGNLVHKSEDLYLHAHIPPKKRHDFLSLTAQDSVEQDSVQWLELDFRTISQDVVLLAIHFEGARKSIIQIINGSVHLTVSNTAPILQISLDKRVDDAQWHRLSLEIADDGKMARLEVDGMAKEEHISTAFPQLITPQLSSLSIGADSQEPNWQTTAFVGCLRRFLLNNQLQPMLQANQANMSIKQEFLSLDSISSGKVLVGCSAKSVCGDKGIDCIYCNNISQPANTLLCSLLLLFFSFLILLLLAYLLHRRRITKLTSDKRGNLPDSQPISQPYIVNSMSSLFSSFPSSCSEMGGYAQVKTSRISDFPNPNGSQVLSISATTAYFEPPISSRREDSACYWSSTIIDSRNPRHSTTLTTATNYENKDFIRVLTKNQSNMLHPPRPAKRNTNNGTQSIHPCTLIVSPTYYNKSKD